MTTPIATPVTAQEPTSRVATISPAPMALLLDAGDVAAMLGCSKATVWRLRDCGKLPPVVKVGSLTKWRKVDIERWIDAGCPAVIPSRTSSRR